ncbi:YopX protein [Lacticaseibacillus paracasei]|uniref:YopX family protein n=1 Tax=Lacticaseibacillus paracasei TaxID=1597 RepID=UPI000F43DF8D|nr:YopX family protein [Lacticaseibacillus paracasei]RND62126.1 YopX protein [Lacticaseibacillus paracasei]RND68734.1 YopX protein [Lacticaseibacillus paracasei]
MKREIKFRAWDKGYECYLYDVQGAYDTLSGCVKYENGENAVYDEECFAGFLDNDQYVVEQYTGLHDKNGREIYENDVLQCTSYTYGNGETGKTSLLVKYHEMSAGFIAGPYMLGKLMDIRKCEVIGNIFENPEMLEADENDD